MPTDEQVADRVDETVADRLRVSPSAFDDSTRFDGETLDADSLDLVEIAEAVEADVGVHVPDDELSDLDTVGELKNYVLENRE